MSTQRSLTARPSHKQKWDLTMLISEMVSMLAMSRLIPTITGPSGNQEEASEKCLNLTSTHTCESDLYKGVGSRQTHSGLYNESLLKKSLFKKPPPPTAAVCRVRTSLRELVPPDSPSKRRNFAPEFRLLCLAHPQPSVAVSVGEVVVVLQIFSL